MHRELEHQTPAHVARPQMKALREFDRCSDLKRIAVRTLVATGTDDLLVKPPNFRLIARPISGACLEMLDGLGHRAIWEAPEEMAGLAGDFLTGPRPTPISKQI